MKRPSILWPILSIILNTPCPTTLPTNIADPHPSPGNDTTYKSTSKNRKLKKNRNSKQHVTHDSTTCALADCLTCADENVINLSGTLLDQSQVALLSKRPVIPASADLETKEITGNLN